MCLNESIIANFAVILKRPPFIQPNIFVKGLVVGVKEEHFKEEHF
jgi:hypothetical protein